MGLLTDGEATGTIDNRTRCRGRSGRGLAAGGGASVEHVEGRLQGAARAGVRGWFAGREAAAGGWGSRGGAGRGVGPQNVLGQEGKGRESITNGTLLCTASRTASRFGYCQPFSDLMGPVVMGEKLNKCGGYWVFGFAVYGLRVCCSTS